MIRDKGVHRDRKDKQVLIPVNGLERVSLTIIPIQPLNILMVVLRVRGESFLPVAHLQLLIVSYTLPQSRLFEHYLFIETLLICLHLLLVVT